MRLRHAPALSCRGRDLKRLGGSKSNRRFARQSRGFRSRGLGARVALEALFLDNEPSHVALPDAVLEVEHRHSFCRVVDSAPLGAQGDGALNIVQTPLHNSNRVHEEALHLHNARERTALAYLQLLAGHDPDVRVASFLLQIFSLRAHSKRNSC